MDDIIKWSSVANAGSYIVQIGDETHQATTVYLEYPISSLLSESDSGLYIKVKALPSSALIYSESDWSALYGPVDYNKSNTDPIVIGFGDAYKSNGLGRSINMITGTSYEPVSGAVSIFDTDKLYQRNLIEERIGTQQAVCSSGESFDEVASGWALSVDLKVAKDGGQKIDKSDHVTYLPGSLDFGVDLTGGYEVRKESETKQFYYKMHQNITGKRIEIQEYKDTSAFSQMLSSQFLQDAKNVNDGIMQASTFINKYGTHVIMSAYYGDRKSVV